MVSAYTAIDPDLAVTIHCGLSHAFLNKENRTGKKAAFSCSFRPSSLTALDLYSHVTAGKAFALGYFRESQRTRDTFGFSELLGLDFDDDVSIEALLDHELVRDYALFLYPTPSHTEEHPRTRVVFRLSEPVEGADRWETLASGLIEAFQDCRPDTKCKDAARFFYGSDVPGATFLGKTLPLFVAGGLLLPQAMRVRDDHEKLERDPLVRERRRTGVRRPPLELVKEVERQLSVTNAPVNAKGYILSPISCPVGIHENDDLAPAAYWNKDICALKCFKCDKAYNTIRVARALGIDYRRYYPEDRKSTQTALANLRIDRQINQLFIDTGLYRQHRDLLLKSDMGTGKTEAIIPLFKGKRVLSITAKQALSARLHHRLGLTHYKDVGKDQWAAITQLGIVPSELVRLAQRTSEARAYDIVFLDEVEQLLGYLGTFQGRLAEEVYGALCALVRQAGQVIATDAFLSPVSQNWLESLRGPVTTVENTFRRARPPLTMYQQESGLLAETIRLVDEQDGPVVIALNSEEKGFQYKTYFENQYGREAVYWLHGESGGDWENQALVMGLENRIAGYRVFLYTPTLECSISIDTPVRAVCGFFGSEPLVAPALHQMLHRFRNPKAVLVWIRPGRRNLLTDADILFAGKLMRAARAAYHANYEAYGLHPVSETQKELQRLFANAEALHSSSKSDLPSHFRELAQAQGYEITEYEHGDERLKEAMKAVKQQCLEQEKAAVLAARPVSPEKYKELKAQGQDLTAARYGLKCWIIEDLAGVEITPELYNLLHDKKERAKFQLLVDVLCASEAEMQERDRAEVDQLPGQRTMHTEKYRLLRSFLYYLYGADDSVSGKKFSGTEVEQAVRPFLESHEHQLSTLFGHRKGGSKKPHLIAKWLLGQMHLKLISERSGHGNREYDWYIDGEFLQRRLDMARHAYEHRRAR